MKSRKRIICDNLFTLFNFLNFAIAGLLFAVGAYKNMLFLGVIILNIIIGTAQELKARKLVEELSLLNRPSVRLFADGREQAVALEDLKRGDIMILKSGDQICADAEIVSGMLEVNESLLTGESDAIVKDKGSGVLSGSSVISGKAYARVLRAGEDSYTAKLSSEVKKIKQAESELLGSMKKVTKFTSFLIIPLGILLFLEAFVMRSELVDSAILSSSAALLGMLPKGLVLLISVSLAAGVIRLAKMKILVQNIYSLETLAHVDVLCLDKTGTLTDGNLKVHSVIPATSVYDPGAHGISQREGGEVDHLIASYFAASDDNNATFQALQEAFAPYEYYSAERKIPFSSRRKWGCISFEGAGSIFLGAPERLLQEVPKAVEQALAGGYRVVVIGYYGSRWESSDFLPQKILPLYFVVLEDTIRPGTQETLEFFHREGVAVKVISGDHIKTAAITAKRAGLVHWKDAVDLARLAEAQGETALDYDALVERYSVFARVSPQQKQELVKAMKRQGHQVAMTGDGVNDLLALREADCSIAVADGSDASRQVAQVVLLESDFTQLPQVVMEGRRVVNNVTRTAGVFFIKTIYSLLVSFLCLALNMPFPFIPIQITLVDACMEAYPSFLTILEAHTEKIRGRFLPTALGNALPYGVAVSVMVAAVSLTSSFGQQQTQTVMYLLLILISMVAVFRSCIPINPLRLFICVTNVIGTFGALLILPDLFSVSAVTMPMAIYIAGALAGAFAVIAVVMVLQKIYRRRTAKTLQKKKFTGKKMRSAI